LDIQTKELKYHYNGIRKSFGITFNPKNNDIWFSDQGPTFEIGEFTKNPPDEINFGKEKSNYGFPCILFLFKY
jgi:glucose/arabinose dehydrogenase